MIAAGTASRAAGRNDPCPCGSGKKFKHCCFGKPAAATLAPEGYSLPPPVAGTSAERTPAARQQAEASDKLHRRGVELLRAGRPVEAAIALRKAIETRADRAETHHVYGLALARAGHLDAATLSLRQAVALDPKLADAYQELGVVLDRQGRDLEAVQAYGQAAALSGKRSKTYRRIGELWQGRGQPGQAIAAYQRGAAVSRDAAERHLLTARALLLEGKLREAESLLRRTVALDRGNSTAESDLAEILLTQGQFAEGIQHYERALAINPRHARAWLGIARASKFTDADRPRLPAMQSALAQPGMTKDVQLILHFAMGKVCDDLGDHEDAMRHFDAANRIRSSIVRYEQATTASFVDRIIARFTPAFFAAHAGLATADAMPLLILGMPRSGTTLVEQIVSCHPAIAAGGELMYWPAFDAKVAADDLDLTPEGAHASAAGYLSTLRSISATAARVTDKMPFNFLLLGLIHLLLPNARIIHCRRHPIDTCVSIYSTFFEGRMEFATSKANLAFFYRQYARLMDHWRAVLPPDRFIEVQYERLIDNREAETRRLIAFTGLDWDDACLMPEKNERAVRTASLWQVRRPVYASSVERWRRYEPWLGELASLADHPHAADAQRH